MSLVAQLATVLALVVVLGLAVALCSETVTRDRAPEDDEDDPGT